MNVANEYVVPAG